MAVYTKFDKKDIEEILSNYSIGKLKSFKGIQEGIENAPDTLLRLYTGLNKGKQLLKKADPD